MKRKGFFKILMKVMKRKMSPKSKKCSLQIREQMRNMKKRVKNKIRINNNNCWSKKKTMKLKNFSQIIMNSMSIIEAKRL